MKQNSTPPGGHADESVSRSDRTASGAEVSQLSPTDDATLIPGDPILGAIYRCVAEVLPVSAEVLQPTTRLVDDLGAESMDLVELSVAVEEALGIEVPDRAFTKVSSLADLRDVVAPFVGGPA